MQALTDYETELEATSAAEEHTNIAQQRQALQARRQLWRPERRRVNLIGIINSDGTIATDDEAAAKALADHWSPVFAIKSVDSDAFEMFRPFVQRAPEDIQWAPSIDNVYEVFGARRQFGTRSRRGALLRIPRCPGACSSAHSISPHVSCL